MLFQGRSVGHDLKGRTGRVGRLDSLIADIVGYRLSNRIRIKCRIISHREYFAGLRHDHYRHPRLCVGGAYTFFKRLLDHILIGGINRQDNVARPFTLGDRFVINTA